MIPALFMTFVTSVYILLAKEGLELPPVLAYSLGGAFTVFIWMVFMQWRYHFRKGDLKAR